MNARVTELGTALLAPDPGSEPLAHRALRQVLRVPGAILDLIDAIARPRAVASRAYIPEGSRTTSHDRVHVHTPEAYLALQPGLLHHRDGEDWAAFHVRGGTALVVGGAQAPADRRQQVLRGVLDTTRALGTRRQVLFPVRPSDLADVRAVGFDTVEVGVEAWVDLDGFTLAGKRWAHLRQMRNRADKRGVDVEETRPGPWDDAMTRVWERWVRAKQPRWSLRWLTGTPSLEHPLDRRYFVAHAAGRLQAFCTFLPGPDGTWAVDVICRAPDAIPGSMERLLVHALQTLRAEGARAVNLGPCPLAHVEERGSDAPTDGWIQRMFRWAWRSDRAEAVLGFRGLHAFKAKFRPRFEPVYLAAAPRVGPVELYAAARVWALS